MFTRYVSLFYLKTKIGEKTIFRPYDACANEAKSKNTRMISLIKLLSSRLQEDSL